MQENLTRYFLDGQNVLMELNQTNQTEARYTGGLELDTWLSMQRDGESFVYHKDGLGSITELSDNISSPAATYEYDIYGNVNAQTGDLVNPYTYTGREYDSESGNYYYRSRYYDLEIGRFTKKDSFRGIGGRPMSLNRYNYVEGNVINNIDPHGRYLIGDYIPIPIPSDNILASYLSYFQSEYDDDYSSEQPGTYLSSGESWFGNFCGPANKENKDKNLKPQGPLDEACQRHDERYDLQGAAGPLHAIFDFRPEIISADRELALAAWRNLGDIFTGNSNDGVGATLSVATAFSLITFYKSINSPFNALGNQGSQNGDIVVLVVKDLRIRIIRAFDPNDITGPSGYAADKWISNQKDLSYKIRFENDPDFATGPAQNVIIKMPIDENADIFSFRLGDFGFGNFVFSAPENSTYYATSLDVSDSLGVIVDVTAGIDVDNQEAFWIFESKDPVTGLAPQGAFAGFLPVNDSLTGNGEGFASFTMLAGGEVSTGDSLRAQANIIFDDNEPIFTNRWYNLIDAVAPTSKVNTLPESTEETEVTLNWSGEDDTQGVGLESYALYVSEGEEPYQLLAEDLDTTAYLFQGEAGVTYSFFSRATDFVGNQEAFKDVAEASITLGVADGGPRITRLLLVDAENDLVITEILEGQTIDLDTLASRELTIQALTQPDVVGSVDFQLSGDVQKNQLENTAPYNLFGDRNQGRDYLGQVFCPGSYQIAVTPYAERRREGEPGNTFVRNFTLTSSPTIEDVVLVSAATQDDLLSFSESTLIDLDETGNVLNVRADAPCANSIVFVLKDDQGTIQHSQTESLRPFTLFGDQNGIYNPWIPIKGDYTLEVTPYVERGGRGISGNTLSFDFTIDSIPKPTLDGVVLINASSDQEIRTLVDNMVINLEEDGDQLNIQAKFNPQGSVGFTLKDAQGEIIQEGTESFAPFALFGDQSGDFNPWTPEPGIYQLEVTPYTGKKATGKAGIAEIYHFEVIDPDLLSLDQVVLVNATSNQTIRQLDMNETIDLGLINDPINIVAEAAGAKSIQFVLKNDAGSVIQDKTESIAPFAFFGDQNGNFNPWEPEKGNYTLEVTPYPESRAGGQAGITQIFALEIIKPLSLEELVLMDATKDEEISPLVDHMQIDLAQTGNELSVWAKSSEARSVSFILKMDNGQIIHQKTESVAPFALFGDEAGGNFNSWIPDIGKYQLEVTPYSQSKAGGKAGITEIRNFEVISSASEANIQGEIVRIYPNTTQDYVYLDFSNGYQSKVQCELRYPSGNLIVRQVYEVNEGQHLIRIDLTQMNLSQGVYYLHVEGKNLAPFSEKIVKY